MALASTANYINTGGGHLILQSTQIASSAGSTVGASSAGSTNGYGQWIPVHPKIREMTVQAILQGSSAGAAVYGSVAIQGSNDGVTPISSTLGFINFAGSASPQADGFAIDAHYNFIRAILGGSSGTTMSSGSTMSVIVSPHNVGGW